MICVANLFLPAKSKPSRQLREQQYAQQHSRQFERETRHSARFDISPSDDVNLVIDECPSSNTIGDQIGDDGRISKGRNVAKVADITLCNFAQDPAHDLA